jgi:hypothetical protein
VKLHSPSFEKNLRRGVKKAVRSSPALKQEYRAARKGYGWSSITVNWLIRLVWPVFLGMYVSAIVVKSRHPAAGLAVINIWTFACVSVLVQSLGSALYRASDLPALLLLPVSESTIFRWELQKFCKKRAIFRLFDQLAAFAALGICLRLSRLQWAAAMMLAVLSWITLLALTALCAARLPRVPYSRISATLFVLGLALLLTSKMTGPSILTFLDSAAPTLNVILPTGWAPSLFQLVLPRGNWVIAALIIPVVIIIGAIPNSLQLLKGRLKFSEPTIAQSPEQFSEIIPSATAPANETNQPPRAGVTAIEEIIQSRRFLLRMQPQGWLEMIFLQWLSARERVVAEFAFPTGVQITKPWLLILRNSLLTVVVGFAAGTVSQPLEHWLLGIGLFITVNQCLARMWANGVAFRSMRNGGVLIPVYAAYPISFRELSRTLLKVSIIQLPFFLIYTMAAAVVIGHLAGLDLMNGIVLGFKSGFLIFAGRFIITALSFSSGTSDTVRFSRRSIALVSLIIGGCCLFLGLGGTGLFLRNAPVAWLLWLAAIFEAYGVFRIYGWFYHANRFDLIRFPQR